LMAGEGIMATIGFIGLGNMGGPMARNLIGAGHHLRVFDIMPAAVARTAAFGAEPATDVASAARGVEVLITMLPAGEQMREVYLAEDGVIASASPGTLLIDSSTIDVATAREVATVADTAGFDMIDAPVSGGVAGAEAATLSYMVGGSEAAFAAAEPVLRVMGKTVVHAGATGNGQVAKICNNLILGVSMVAVCEAFVLAERLGLPAQTLFDIASQSSGQCWSLTSYCPVPGLVPASPANRDYRPGFSAAMMLKDLRLAESAATNVDAATELATHAAALYADFVAADGRDVDFSGIIKMIRARSTVGP
jgi:3-hydroxyisobutyrate dehydrogenase